MNDLRFALRQLRKSPGFSALAIITLAIGIGLNTAIFSLINDLFLRGLPFKEPSRVVHLYGGDKSRDLEDIGVSAPRYQHFRDGQTMFDGLAGENFFLFTLTGLGDPVQVFGGRLTSNYFDLLAVRPILGRNFLPQEEEGADVAVVTKNFWQKRLGGDPNVIGRSITLDGTPHTIVGVLPNMPATWFGANPIAEVWTMKPFQVPGFSYERMMRGTSFLRVIGRMKPNITLKQVKAALPSLDQSYRAQYTNKIDSGFTTTVKTLPEDVTENFRAGFITLFAAVTFVLLIACSNVANLLLVRFSGRRREIALRMAIGANRRNVVRLFVLESATLSVIAGIIGLCLALWIVDLVPKIAGDNVPLEGGIKLHWAVLVFTLLLSLLTGLSMGCYPAWQSSRADLIEGLKESNRTMSASRGQHRFRRGLVSAQVALSMVLLAAAAMLASSFVRLSNQETGFRSDHVWAAGIGLPAGRYPDPASRARFAQRLVEEVQASPGVEVAATVDAVPLSANHSRP